MQTLLQTNTYRSLQQETGVNEHIFSELAKEYGIPKNEKLIGRERNKKKLIKFDYNVVYDMYINQHKSTRDIAKYYKCEHATVEKYMRDNNIPLRNAHDKICYESRRVLNAYYGIDSNGYILLKVDGEFIREHRYVMECFLKRKLGAEEVVHHINFIKTDNSIENLFLFSSNAIHATYHSYIETFDYIPPDDFVNLYEKEIDKFFSYENLFNLYVKENKSIAEIGRIFADQIFDFLS